LWYFTVTTGTSATFRNVTNSNKNREHFLFSHAIDAKINKTAGKKHIFTYTLKLPLQKSKEQAKIVNSLYNLPFKQ